MPKLTWNPPAISTTKATFIWDVDYAADVHEGETRTDGTRRPARRWTDAAIAESNLPEMMLSHFEETKDIGEAFKGMATDLGDRFTKMIEDERWDWDRTTRRSDGTVVTSPRDIVDTGALRDSQRLEFDSDEQ